MLDDNGLTMKYRVKANLILDKATDFYKVLTDGTVQNQRPGQRARLYV